jgi:hypothetical protein
MNARGDAIVVFNQWYGEHWGVGVAARALGWPWSTPRSPEDVLSPAIFYSNAPTVALNASGDALIAWYQSPGGQLMTYASERIGPFGRFSHPSPPAFLSADGAPVDSHPIANPSSTIADDRSAAVVWTQENGHGACPVYVATRDPSLRWDRPYGLGDTLSSNHVWARAARPILRPTGELVVVWYEEEKGALTVKSARRLPSGAWLGRGQGELLSAPGARAVDPAIAMAPDGCVLVTWVERGQEGSPFRVMARRLGEAWESPIVLSQGDEDANSPSIAVGASGRALAAWSQGKLLQAKVHVRAIDFP